MQSRALAQKYGHSVPTLPMILSMIVLFLTVLNTLKAW